MSLTSLIIATGSNQGDKSKNLQAAKEELSKHFAFIAESRVYQSAAIEYLEQADFFNQALEFKVDSTANPDQVMDLILEIEKNLGRIRKINKGPRIIDIDIIFWGTKTFNTKNVNIPHPSWKERSFVVLPIKELPFSNTLEMYFTLPSYFKNNASPIS